MRLPHSAYVLIALSGGIIIAAFTPCFPLLWLLTGLILTVAGIIRYIHRGNLGWLLLLGCLIGGGFWFSMSRFNYLRQVEHYRTFHQREISVDGTIGSRPEASRNGFWFILQAHANDRLKVTRGRIIVFVKNVPSDDWYGRKITVRGRFRAVGPKVTGFPDYMEIEKIAGSISALGSPQFQAGFGLPPPFIWADRIRQKLTRFGAGTLEPRNARLLHGIIFGDPLGDVDDRFIINLRRTSTIHLLSVSGMHVGFLALTLNFLLGLCKVPKGLRVLPLIAGIWFYIMMTGMDPPPFRAGIMLIIALTGGLLKAGDIPLNRLGLAAIVLLLMNPFNLFDPSFQLTFAAAFGVSCLYPLLVEYLPVKRKYLGSLWKALLVSISAQLTIAPILIQYFQSVSWVSPLANIILVGPGEVVVIGGLAGEIIGNFWPWLGGQVLTIINFILNLMRIFINWCGDMPWSASWSPQWTWPWIAGYYLGLALLLDSLRPNLLNQKQRCFKVSPVLFGFLLLINLSVWGIYFNQLKGDYLQVLFIDVGQGDAILIRSPKGEYTMIDGGDEGRGKRAILPYLRMNGVFRLEMAFLTHYHKDHWGGIIEVLKEVPANTVFLPPPRDTNDYSEFEAQFKFPQINRRTVGKGMLFDIGKGASLEVLEVPNLDSENDRSVVLLVTFGKNRLLLTGDLSFKGEDLLLKKNPHRLNAAVLKVGHHGSNYSSGVPFLSQIKPGLAMISVGAANRFGHPGPATINRLRSLGAKIFRTDSLGIIDCRIYRDRVLVRTTKGGK